MTLTATDRADLNIYYCGICQALRAEYGLASAALNGFETRLVALLVGAQQAEVAKVAATRCPARLALASRRCVSDDCATRYAAAISLLLFWAKLDDDVNDTNSLTARCGQRVASRYFQRAMDSLKQLEFPVRELLNVRSMQREIETKARGATFADFTYPSGRAIGMVLAHTAKLANSPDNTQLLQRLGDCLGRVITLLDACLDYDKDAARGEYNPVAVVLSRQPTAHLQAVAMRQLQHFLLVLLREIRHQFAQLTLHRYQSAIANVLCAGLFDSSMRCYTRLAARLECTISQSLSEIVCPYCETIIQSHFCVACGSPRPLADM